MHVGCRVSALTLLLLSGPAFAGPNEDAYAAIEQWVSAYNAGDVDRILGAYTSDATLLPSSSPSLVTDLRAYFERALKAKVQIRLGEGKPTTIGENAVVWTGFYDFSGSRPEGQPFVIPGRFTFVVVKRDGNWKIAHHHSSNRPKSP